MKLEALRVVGVDISTPPHEALFDEYIPLQVRSFSSRLGSGYLRLGDYSKTLLELAVEQHSQRLRAAALTSLARLDAWPAIGVRKVHTGSPVLATSCTEYVVVDLAVEFQVAIGDEGLVVFWQGLDECEACDSGRMKYLVVRGLLAGIWCTELMTQERELFHTAAEI